jgi:DNA-binding transcriptional LysR family regulator
MNAKTRATVDASDLSLVLALARARTLAGAAEFLDVDVSTIFRRLNELERRLRVRLFERSKRGYHLTAAGERATAAAERIETELHALDREITGRDQQLTGALRVTASETLSHSALPRLFATFRESHPGIELILNIDNRVLDLGRREADVALRTRRPSQGDLFGRRLAGIAWAFYGGASTRRSLKREGSRLDFSRHDVIGWDHTEARIVASAWIEAQVPASQLVYRSNSLVNQLMAVRAGVGIALLPCYLADPVPEVRRLTAALPELEGELWIVTHKDLKETARVRAFLTIVGDGIAAQRTLFEGRSKRVQRG